MTIYMFYININLKYDRHKTTSWSIPLRNVQPRTIKSTKFFNKLVNRRKVQGWLLEDWSYLGIFTYKPLASIYKHKILHVAPVIKRDHSTQYWDTLLDKTVNKSSRLSFASRETLLLPPIVSALLHIWLHILLKIRNYNLREIGWSNYMIDPFQASNIHRFKQYTIEPEPLVFFKHLKPVRVIKSHKALDHLQVFTMQFISDEIFSIPQVLGMYNSYLLKKNG
ncbi:hypothetical protein BDF21DRAFT_457083 [Thamnidium elegans]|nr:hypothetical protein BDF21DRAFT_457083 [Thamnidium elegans]